ncbi:MAG: TIGR02611 family protein [Actinomycetota bacterium]|nr:TIGR02611 family protein [Actinomycetota bacterium]
MRERLDGRPLLRRVFKLGVAVFGTAVLIVGVILIPYPGPGWLVVFAGLAILATEFAWAGRLLAYARARYDTWFAWLARQRWWVKLLVVAATAAIVLPTLWLLNALWVTAGWVGLHSWTWLQSPIG